MKRDDLAIIALHATESNEEILDQMRKCRALRESGVDNIVCFIDGHNQDTRELWEIPEARAFCKRLVDLGFISYLDYWTTGDKKLCVAMGAVEVIAIAESKGVKPVFTAVDLMTRFKDVVLLSNERADAAIGPMAKNA